MKLYTPFNTRKIVQKFPVEVPIENDKPYYGNNDTLLINHTFSINNKDEKARKRRWFNQWKVILAAGIDRNIVVVDNSSQCRVITTKLIKLMNCVVQKHNNDATKLTKIFIGTEQYNNLLEDIKYDYEDMFYAQSVEYVMGGFIRIFGIDILPLNQLDCHESLYNYYFNELNGCMPEGKDNLTVGIVEDGKTFISFELIKGENNDKITYSDVIMNNKNIILGVF